MSSSTGKRIKSSAGIAMAAVLLVSGLSVQAQENEVDSWIKESGYQAAKPGIREISESELRAQSNTQLPKPPSQPKQKAEQLAQKLPANVTAAINAAAPGSTSSSVPLLKGQVTYCVPSGTPLKLKLATVPMPQMKMDMRDEEGNLRPAQLGEVITAKITEDIYVDDNKVIPEGTVFRGRVAKIFPPRHVGRPGHLELSFDRFTTPDGRSFAFRAEANNFHESTTKSKVKGAGRLAAHAAGGAALGALVAYKVFGLENTIAMHGYNIAGGAAVGAVGGLAYALWKRGPHAVLEPGDEFAMSINTDLLIPAASTPTSKAPPLSIPGFEMDVVSKKIIKDGFGGHMLRLESWITNNTHKKFNSIDLFLEDDLGNRCPVSPDEDEEAQEIFYIQPLSRSRIVCTFQVEYPKLKHKVIWLDHHTHSIIFEQKL